MADESPVAVAATGSELLFQPPPAVDAPAPVNIEQGYALGMRLECRDEGDEWVSGIVTCLKPLKIRPIGSSEDFEWEEVRQPEAEAPPAEIAAEPAEAVAQTLFPPVASQTIPAAVEPVAQPAETPTAELVAQPAEAKAPVAEAPVAAAPAEPEAPAETPEEALARKSSAALKRMQELLPGVKDGYVLEQIAELSNSAALETFLKEGAKKPAPTPTKRWSVKDMAAAASAGAPVNSQPAQSPQAQWAQRKSLNGGGAPVSSFVASQQKSTFVGSESMTKAHASQEVAKNASKHLGLVNVMGGHGAGQGGGLGLNRPGAGPKVNHFAGGGRGGAKSITVHEDASMAWSEMLDDNSATAWVIGTYSSDMKTLNLGQKGEGGLQSFKDSLPQDMAWGGFRCFAVDKRGGLECKRKKFLFVCYKPQSVSQIKKAKQASHKGDVKEAFTNAHLDVVVESMEDLDEQSLIEKLQAATGAHKPNGYEFEEGEFVEADFYGLGIGKNCKGESAKGNA